MILEKLESGTTLKQLRPDELSILASEIRDLIITTVSRRGGHLSSNLGVVELTIALHRVFDFPKDKIVFDVGHQSYVHKILTGRAEQFGTLRTYGGLAGFPKRGESPYDVFETGHASTAISAALGLARARDFRREDGHVIALVGDGALTGGMCYEALNDAGETQTPLIVILNDNEMSISANVGALSKHLTDLRASTKWENTKRRVRRFEKVPIIGKPVYRIAHRAKIIAKSLMVHEGFFGTLGFHYLGPIDGHDIAGMEKTLRRAKESKRPVLIHVKTLKGYGYDKAEDQPEIFHGTPPFYVETGDRVSVDPLPGCGHRMADVLAELARDDRRIVAVTAAMPKGTGLDHFAEIVPDRMLDVGITEEHAVTMCAGLAAGGMKPYLAVYASFFQRGFDQMIHDVCMQELPVTFLLDRAGLVGEDGSTHHGLFDLASMIPIPNMTILAPADLTELEAMIRWSVGFDRPCAIRYGKKSILLKRPSGEGYGLERFTPGKWRTLEPGEDCALFAVGSMTEIALETASLLKTEQGISARVVNCSTVKPLDTELLAACGGIPKFTLEEHMLTGGFGSYVNDYLVTDLNERPAVCFGVKDRFIQHGPRDKLLEDEGLTPALLAAAIVRTLKGGSPR